MILKCGTVLGDGIVPKYLDLSTFLKDFISHSGDDTRIQYFVYRSLHLDVPIGVWLACFFCILFVAVQ